MTKIAPFTPVLRPAVQKFLDQKHLLLIDGRWVAPQQGKSFQTIDPGAGKTIATVSEGDAADVDLAVAAARTALETTWADVSPADRSKLLWKFADLLETNIDGLAEVESLNNGMPIAMARYSVIAAADLVRYMAGWATKISGETLSPSTPGSWHAFTTREPIGVVGQIIPWNAPISMAIWKIAPALAAGCTVVLKPAEQTSLSALWLGALILEAGFPAGVVNIITGYGHTAGAALAHHPDVDKIAFTGSTQTGRIIAQAATGNMKRVSLELGGKSPMIVFPDADIEKIIPGLTMGAYFNTGQVCAAGTRLFAHRAVFDKLVEGIAAQASRFKIGHGLNPENNLGPLISQQQQQRVSQYVETGKNEGSRVFIGGAAPADDGYFFEPTLLVDTAPNMRVMREEIFGPVLCATPFNDDDLNVIAAEANNTEYGLAASIWTRDISVAHKLAKKIKSGSVGVNTHILTDPVMPFGGYKQSGWGREKGRDVLELYTQVKSVAIAL